MRLAVVFALGYTAVLALLLGAFVWSTWHDVDPQVAADLNDEAAALHRAYTHGGSAAVADEVERLQAKSSTTGRWYLLVGPGGEVRGGQLLRWPIEAVIPTDGQLHREWLEDKVIPTAIYDNDAFCAVVALRWPDRTRALIAQHDPEAEGLREITERLTEALAAVAPLALLMGVGLGWTIQRRMDRLGRTAEEIAAGDLSRRVPVSPRDDEFDLLARRLNAMLDRIQQLIAGMREVTDNVAHDLRGPLTRLRSRLEVTLLEPRAEPEYRQAIGRAVEDAESVIGTFNALLGIAQAEAGSPRSAMERVDLGGLAVDLGELYEAAAEGRGQTLTVDARTGAQVAGHRHLLAQAIGNLLDNAIKYTPTGGRIALAVDDQAGRPVITVADTGPGIPEAHRSRALERFVRLDGARDTPGNGLGLSLVSAVCRLYGAELVLDDARPGLLVRIVFPAAPAA
jgi:signal transduction histidine kinase